MADFSYYDLIISNMERGTRVERLVHGISWTAAVLSDGRAGVAMHTEGDIAPRMLQRLEGLDAKDAAEAVKSWNFEEASEALAVINAYFNTPERLNELNARSSGQALEDYPSKGKKICFIGKIVRNSGLSIERLESGKDLFILEREPKPGTLPDSACEFIIPKCDAVLITGSAAINKTLPRLLELCKGRYTALTGPSVTMCPALLEMGINSLNGSVITDVDGLLEGIMQKRTPVMQWSEFFRLSAE